MLIFIPKKEAIENNNLFNCNLNSLKEFFPPHPFPLPKETTLYNISDYLNPNNNYDYIRSFKHDMELVGNFKIERLYYEIMKKDLGISFDDIPICPPAKLMFDLYYKDISEKADTNTVSEEKINDMSNMIYMYYLLADKNLSHAKDELKRMRLSVTAMNKRLIKQDNKSLFGRNNKSILEYTKYLRFILETYELYITDKTTVSKQIYLRIARHLEEYYDSKHLIPDKLSMLLKEDIIMR